LEDEAKNGPHETLYEAAYQWAHAQDESGLSPISEPKWVDQMLSVLPSTASGRKVQELAEAIRKGTAFQSKAKTVTWTAYSYDLPYQDRTVVFSATAHLEGWQFGKGNEFVQDYLPTVDYENVSFHHKPWPVGLPKHHKQIMYDRPKRIEFVDYVFDWIGYGDSETLVICPKAFKSDIETRFPHVNVVNYGRDIGSNEYRECTRVFVVSEHHIPNNTHRAGYLGHSGVERATEAELKPIQNTNSDTMKKVKSGHYATHLKQMIARSNIRNVDTNGKAGHCEVHCMIDDERFLELIPELFPNATLGTSPSLHVTKTTASVETKCMSYLQSLPPEVTEVTAKDLAGIKIRGKAERLIAANDRFCEIGWRFHEGQQGGKPAVFRRELSYARPA
jgi:hypothetical protein